MMAAIRAVLLLLVVLAISVSSVPSNAIRALSFEQRVAAQEAIERVYYFHRNGTTRSFEEAVPRSVLENKVRNYLAQSAALEQLWNQPVTGEMLRQETERMAQSSSLPERLRELFSALGNDRFLVQECLARPILVNRLARQHFAYDETIHEKARQEAELLRHDLLTGAIDRYAKHPSRRVVHVLVGSEEERPSGSRYPQDGPDGIPRRALDPVGFSSFRAGLAGLGAIGRLHEKQDGFVFQAVLDDVPDSVLVATYSVRKRSWDDWWSEVSATLDGRSVRTSARLSSSLPAVSVLKRPCPDWAPTATGADTPAAREFHQAVPDRR